VELNTNATDGNVNLRIADITDKMFANLPDEAVDLLEIATYVYCADQATLRGGKKEFEYGKKWRRHFRFEIPVRVPDKWSSSSLKKVLQNTLGFLSDDDYDFHFTNHGNPPPREGYLEFDVGTDNASPVDEVVLFSGGLDSFAGAIHELNEYKSRVALVSHRSVSKIDKRQRDLVDDLRKHVATKPSSLFHVPVWINKDKELGKEYTQRSRSFLYASLGSIVARVFGLSQIKFFENGVVSLNLPVTAQAIGGRATRTTHPKVLNGFASIFSHIFSVDFNVENPFAWKTKAELLTQIKEAGFSKICAYTSSCAHPWEQTKIHTHCGRCSQCVDRRLVALAAKYSDEEDPPEMYKIDVMLGERKKPEDINLIESYMRMMTEINRMDDAIPFCTKYGEVSRIIREVPGKADDAAQQVFDLYKRHAKQVCDAVESAAGQHLSELVHHELPDSSLLSVAMGRRVAESAARGSADQYEWARQVELVRAVNQVLGKDTLNKGVLSKACGNEIKTNGQNGRASMVHVKSFLDWIRSKHSLVEDEIKQVRNAIVGEIIERNK
jgi:7-cyano-7-deazaguanine synthase in queuosine biosynthesis